jgi:glutathione transport system permease protein
MTQASGVPAETLIPTTPVAAVQIAGKVRTPWGECWRRFKKQPVGIVAAVFVLLLVFVAVFAPWIVPFDRGELLRLRRAEPAAPRATHWFGVDPLGRDIFSRILAWARASR